jgi:hypothetical protein
MNDLAERCQGDSVILHSAFNALGIEGSALDYARANMKYDLGGMEGICHPE